MGYDKVEWDMEPADSDEGQGVRLSYRSKDGEEARRRRARRACRCAVPHARRRVRCPEARTAPLRRQAGASALSTQLAQPGAAPSATCHLPALPCP